MEPGRLVHRIVIMSFTTVRTPSGQPVEQWLEGKTISADIRGMGVSELLAAGVERSEADVNVFVRQRADITATSRLKVIVGPFKGWILNVIGNPMPYKKNLLKILCKQGTEK